MLHKYTSHIFTCEETKNFTRFQLGIYYGSSTKKKKKTTLILEVVVDIVKVTLLVLLQDCHGNKNFKVWGSTPSSRPCCLPQQKDVIIREF